MSSSVFVRRTSPCWRNTTGTFPLSLSSPPWLSTCRQDLWSQWSVPVPLLCFLNCDPWPNSPCFAFALQVWEGLGVVKTVRQMLGETDPAKSLPGTIRGDFCIHVGISNSFLCKNPHFLFTYCPVGVVGLQVGRNVIHGSDSVSSAEKEIQLWFKEGELAEWKSAENDWIYE